MNTSTNRGRVRTLLIVARREGGIWTTSRAQELYRAFGVVQRGTARRDLALLAERGHLVAVPGHDRAYRINQAGGAA
ncbi:MULTISPECIES: hypothetical protein [Streptomyces]|uniref:hypothetical protein n=1 Tax=Streptomyces TaxID=1883 RepID=UPI000F76CB6D|nr:hypothetical protein [Streptomyces sp. WAC05858]RSS39445.1 hypothetical protein EF902_27545 [Streptomyces sp. WAC05858]WTA79291.1 hypothetical protein OG751_04460 [Streptomyces antimycoticus]